jgi:hypothetical protein
MRFARSTIVALVLFYAGPARAFFHSFGINEVYSNSSGTVQYVELKERNGIDFEIFSQGVSMTSGSGGNFVFPSNLTNSDTSNRHLLIASGGFAAIPGAPTPDFTLPNGFLNINGDSVDLGGFDPIAFGALPGGTLSLNRSGASMISATATPTNFAGVSGTVPEPAAGLLILGAATLALSRRRACV